MQKTPFKKSGWGVAETGCVSHRLDTLAILLHLSFRAFAAAFKAF